MDVELHDLFTIQRTSVRYVELRMNNIPRVRNLFTQSESRVGKSGIAQTMSKGIKGLATKVLVSPSMGYLIVMEVQQLVGRAIESEWQAASWIQTAE